MHVVGTFRFFITKQAIRDDSGFDNKTGGTPFRAIRTTSEQYNNNIRGQSKPPPSNRRKRRAIAE